MKVISGTLLQQALDGAKSAGAQTEAINKQSQSGL